MLLEPHDTALFFKLHRTLMCFVNQRLDVIPNKLATGEEFAVLSPEVRLKVRDALIDKLDLIESFVDENPAHLSDDELDIVRSWRHLVAGQFHVFRELKKYTVFLMTTDPAIAYGVLALSEPFEDLVGPYLPVLMQTVLLPFKERIVYDGLMSSFSISFGPGIRRSLHQSFKEAKLRHGIVTSLPKPDKPMALTKTSKQVSREELVEALGVIIRLTDKFCKEHLNEEYAVLCRKLAEKLSRKRPTPILSGSPNTWACGIVRTVGWVNLLHDKRQTPHMHLTEIDAGFSVNETSGAWKLAAIRKMLKIRQLDANWTLPSRLDDNPIVSMLPSTDLRSTFATFPRKVQEIVFNTGLIPHLPADRQQGN